MVDLMPTVSKPSKEFYLEPITTDELAYQECEDWYSTMRDYRAGAGLVDKWAYFNRLYRNQLTDQDNDKNYPYISKIFVPYTFQTIETILSKTLSATLASKPYVSVFPREMGDEKSAPLVEELLDYQIDQIDSFFTKELLFQKQCFMYGKSFKKVFWKFRQIEVGGKRITVYDGPDIETVPVWAVYVDPGASLLQEANCLIHCVYKSEEWLRQQESLGLYKNVTKAIEESQKATGYENEMQDRLRISGSKDDSKYYIKKNQFLVKEYWSRDKLIVVVGQTVVRNTRNPFDHTKIPFVDCNSYPLVAEFYGLGDIEPCAALQEEMNDIRNARMDNVNLQVHQVFLADSLSGLDDEIILSPGLVIKCDNINGIKPLEMTNLMMGAIRAEENLKVDFQTTSGVTDNSKGMTSSGSQTATEAAIQNESSSGRFDVKVKLLQESFKKMAEQIIGLDMQFVTEEMAFRVLGPDGALNWRKIQPEDIARSYDYVPIGSTTLGNKSMQQQMMVNIFGLMKDVPGLNLVNTAMRVLRTAEIKNPEQLFTKEALTQAKQLESAPPQPTLPPGGQVGSPLGGAPNPLAALMGSLGGGAPNPAMAMGIPQGEGVIGTGVNENAPR